MSVILCYIILNIILHTLSCIILSIHFSYIFCVSLPTDALWLNIKNGEDRVWKKLNPLTKLAATW